MGDTSKWLERLGEHISSRNFTSFTTSESCLEKPLLPYLNISTKRAPLSHSPPIFSVLTLGMLMYLQKAIMHPSMYSGCQAKKHD
jgi:hypothetical protein